MTTETEERILRHLYDQSGPLTEEEIAEDLRIQPDELLEILDRLVQTGKVVKTRKGRYGCPEKMNLVVGRFQANSKGFGFVIPDRRDLEDVYIAPKDMNGAMHGDLIIARLSGRARVGGDRKREGEVIRILERANPTIVGRFEVEGEIAFVIPDDRRLPLDILIDRHEWGDAQSGEKVVIAITRWPDQKKRARGRVLYRLGPAGEPGVDILSIIHKHHLPLEFPPEVEAEANSVPTTLSEADVQSRADFRDQLVITIDGADAKDLDDAVTLDWNLPDARWRLGVHIADVSHYVREGTALDEEAKNRGTSVYLVDRVIPMLPPVLSNGICSLHPEVDRLTLSILMDFDDHGRLLRHEITPSVIRSRSRLTYEQVWNVLDQNPDANEPEVSGMDPQIREMLLEAEKLAMVLRQQRFRNGAIDFNLPEAKIILDEQGYPQDVLRKERNFAHQIIEEFMLAANMTVAEEFFTKKVPFVYRIHEEPSLEKVEALEETLSNFGLRLRRGRQLSPKAFQEVLERVQGRPEEALLSALMLRSMQQARYSTECVGHFGLAAPFYCHFTSPIRRYPDLQIHRIIHECLKRGRISKKRELHYQNLLPQVAEHSSIRERQAVEAERETITLKMVEFMQNRVGEEFKAIISGVTSFGLFVQLPNLIEGLVHVSTMTDDYYRYSEKHHSLIGERRRRVYRLGDEVDVLLVKVSKEDLQLDFVLPSMP